MLRLLIRIIKITMSRIGNNPIELPQGVTIALGENNAITCKRT